MERHGEPDSFTAFNLFESPADCLAFIKIQAHAELLGEMARRGYRAHGRGVVLLQGPYGEEVRAWYATATPEDLDGPLMPETAKQDLEEYDPDGEMLVVAMDPAESRLRFWRVDAERREDVLVPQDPVEWPSQPDDPSVLAAILSQCDAFLAAAVPVVNLSGTLKSLIATPGGERAARVAADDLDGLIDRLDLWGLSRFSPYLPPRSNTIRARFYLKRLGRHRARRDYYRGDADTPRAVQGYPPVLRSQGPEAFEILVDDARNLSERLFVKLVRGVRADHGDTAPAPTSAEDQRSEFCYEQGINNPDRTWKEIGAECLVKWPGMPFDNKNYSATLARRWWLRHGLEPIRRQRSKRIDDD